MSLLVGVGRNPILHTSVKESRERLGDMTTGIPGFTIEDEHGNVVMPNPGQPIAGRRAYKNGVQIDRSETARDKSTHDYLLRAPKGLWKAFSRKCVNEGLNHRQALEFLIKDWVLGKIEIEDLATRK